MQRCAPSLQHAHQATCIGFLMTKDMRDKYAFTSFKLPPGSKLLLVRSAKDGLKLMIKVRGAHCRRGHNTTADALRTMHATCVLLWTAGLAGEHRRQPAQHVPRAAEPWPAVRMGPHWHRH